jgi:hypothetical protein
MNMPLQNRVSPYGVLFRTPSRGTLMGNRGGCIHNDRREIVRPFKSRRWIACVLEFKDRHRVVMTPNLYTELFFLDEAVALAAGHRPCAECRRERYNAFRTAWGSPLPTADDMDLALHPARIDSEGRKVKWSASWQSLPDGAFVDIGGEAWLVRRDAMLLWTPEGYARSESRPASGSVTVLTPQPIVECLMHGYLPGIHPSADVL